MIEKPPHESLSRFPLGGFATEIARWALVLPAAVFCAALARYLSAMTTRLAMYGWNLPRDSDFVVVLQLLGYVVSETCFVVAGGLTAPRSRTATSLVLAIAGALLSLATHILVQSRVGTMNYLHFTAESTGALLGVACVVFADRVRRCNFASQLTE